jgi:hypothetical protein
VAPKLRGLKVSAATNDLPLASDTFVDEISCVKGQIDGVKSNIRN